MVPPRQIHAVVRLVHSPDGSQGAAASQAFQEGMVQSDVSYYAGHGRYGSGPDFDRNYESFEYLLPDGSVERTVTDSHVLEHEMTEEGHHNHRSAWSQFLYRVNHTPPLLRVNSSNQGNVFVNPVDRQSNEFGARLMYWNLERTGSGQAPVTGQAGALGQVATAAPERRYRMVVFNGCNTRDYETSVRGTPGFDPRHADTLETTRTVAVADLINTLGVFLDSILGQQSAQQITREMDDAQTQPSGANRGTYVDRGSDLNPVVR